MLASPAVVRSCAKLRSACPVSSGMPSSSNLLPETPNRKLPSSLFGNPFCNSAQVVSNWPSVRLCSNPYKRTYFTRILRLCTKARAEALRLSLDVSTVEIPCSCAGAQGKPNATSKDLHVTEVMTACSFAHVLWSAPKTPCTADRPDWTISLQ